MLLLQLPDIKIRTLGDGVSLPLEKPRDPTPNSCAAELYEFGKVLNLAIPRNIICKPRIAS